jgi:hypothetical protein
LMPLVVHEQSVREYDRECGDKSLLPFSPETFIFSSAV